MFKNNRILTWVLAICFALPSYAVTTTHHAHKNSHTTSTHKSIHHASKTKHHKHITHHAHKKKPPSLPHIVDPNPEEIDVNLSEGITTEFTQTSFVTSMEKRLVDFVQKSVDNLRYSAYKLGGTKVDPSHGIYIVDCSGYVDHTLRAVYPNAYFSLVNATGAEKPNSTNYYNFFTGLSPDSNEYWSKVEDIEKLEPGDILVFRYKTPKKSAGGHVMVVMNKPVQDGDSYSVSVADSAPSGHSEDTRPSRVSGLGIGTLLLKVNPKTGQPSAYAWKIGSRWKNNVNFAMARPTETNS